MDDNSPAQIMVCPSCRRRLTTRETCDRCDAAIRRFLVALDQHHARQLGTMAGVGPTAP